MTDFHLLPGGQTTVVRDFVTISQQNRDCQYRNNSSDCTCPSNVFYGCHDMAPIKKLDLTLASETFYAVVGVQLTSRRQQALQGLVRGTVSLIGVDQHCSRCGGRPLNGTAKIVGITAIGPVIDVATDILASADW